jgi:hypothetical protein
VSVKLIPEICINKASSNSWMTAAGRWATASDRSSQSCPQSLFFFSSLHLMRQQPNYTGMLKNLLKLYCIWTWDTLWCFGVFLGFFPLCWYNRTTSETQSPELEAERLTPKLLLKLYWIWVWRFFFQSSFCLSNACLAYCWLVHYLSLFISLKLVLFCFVYFYLCVCFSLFLYLLWFPSPLTLPF